MKLAIAIVLLTSLLSSYIQGLEAKPNGKETGKVKDLTSTSDKESKNDTVPMGKFNVNAKKLQQKSKRNKSKAKRLRKQIDKLQQRLATGLEQDAKESKKAMIWPKKMLPRLEKMIMKKLSGDDNNEDNPYLMNYDGKPKGHPLINEDTNDEEEGDGGNNNSDNNDENENNFDISSPTAKATDDYMDNWDSIRLKHHHHRHHHFHHHHHEPDKFNGMDVVPLMKMLKKKYGDPGSYDSNGFTGTPSSKGNKFLLKLLMNQAIGKPDRHAVLKDMMQEFFLANGNDREGDEAREALDELVGHNNLIRMNSDLEGQTASVDIGPTQTSFAEPAGDQNDQLPDLQNADSRDGKTQRFGESVLQAQELPNGRIAPLGNQLPPEQRFMDSPQGVLNGVTRPTSRMLSGPYFPPARGPMNAGVAPGPIPVPQSSFVSPLQTNEPEKRPLVGNNQMVIEEETESAARGIKPPPFASYLNEGNFASTQQEMKLGSNFRSSFSTPIDNRPGSFQRDQMDIKHLINDFQKEDNQRVGDAIASILPRRPDYLDEHSRVMMEENAARRQEIVEHKHSKNNKDSGEKAHIHSKQRHQNGHELKRSSKST